MINDPVLINDWHVVARSEDVCEGAILPARLLGQDVVLWRSNGKVVAWQDLCVHRGTRLSLGQVVEGDKLQCPYHGWTYNTEGSCVRIPAHPDQVPPAKARVQTYQVKERYDLVWISLGQPEQDVPPLPEDGNPVFRRVICGPYPYNASGPRAVENFLDIAHFPFVHAGYLGDPSRPEIADYTVETGPDGIVATDIFVHQPHANTAEHGSNFTYTYYVFRPLTAYFIKVSAGPTYSIMLTVTPVETVKSLAWMIISMSHAQDRPEEEIRAFQDLIVSQDVPIVESQRPELLPLDLQAELHLRSDRTAIAYRKWLKELGVTFGVA